MSYFLNFQSFKDKVSTSKSFSLAIFPKSGQACSSSMIPIEVLDEVMVEVEMVMNENNGISIWTSGGDGRITTFPPGTIEKIDIIFYNS